MPSAGTKRRAPWPAEPPRPAPGMRRPMPTIIVLSPAASQQPASPKTNAPASLPPTPELSPPQRTTAASERSPDDGASERTNDTDELRTRLSKNTPEENIQILMALANRDVGMKLAIESENSRLAGLVWEWKCREADETCRQAQAKNENKPLNYEGLLKRVEDFMKKKPGMSWGLAKLISEACKVTNAIDDMFKKLLEHCAEDSPSDVKCATMVTVAMIWEIIILAPCSEFRSQCLEDSVMWEKPCLELWNQLSPLEKTAFASHSEVVTGLVQTAIEWKDHCAREDMFDRWLQDMKRAADGAMSAEYAKWDTRNADKTPEARRQATTASSPPIIHLTLE